MTKIFIDGSAGTTGLQIRERLAARKDIEILQIEEEKRKDIDARLSFMNDADIAFLCLPDESAKEIVECINKEEIDIKIIDTSTAHRTADGWVYGFTELGLEENIKNSKRIANPGCHATGFISIVFPLINCGIISNNEHLSCFSLTGYTGGGKKMIESYESVRLDKDTLESPGIYGLNMQHKHLKEMQKICGLEFAPSFCPIVADFPRGMATSITFNGAQVNGNYKLSNIIEAFNEFYASSNLIKVVDNTATPLKHTTLYANEKAETDALDIVISGTQENFVITALFDNLGKGACGAAIQNMNILMGAPMYEGLKID
jgi:N-acetyl-gamma-glutamyl-phosphate reductase